jgi:phosphoglycolate phosphatase
LNNLQKKKAIIWDWNGTLLDDIELCINSMNSLLSARNLKVLDKNIYREIFTFPVKEYYEKAGFDFSFEPFEVPALQFIDLYYNNLKNANLFPEVKNVLQYFEQKAINQSILSAMEHEKLLLSLQEKGIFDFFENITGIDDHYARSKVEIGLKIIEKIPFSKEEIVLIGDTLHDYEVAESLCVDCILIANGHQSRERLVGLNAIVINNLKEIMGLI